MSGLDYSKIVIIRNSEYIGSTDAIVDKDFLLGKSMKYNKKEFERIYEHSTLQYFHYELGIKAIN